MRRREEEMRREGGDVSLHIMEVRGPHLTRGPNMHLQGRGLLALQGPSMMSCLQPLTPLPLARCPHSPPLLLIQGVWYTDPPPSLGFMSSAETCVGGVECRVTRWGTGGTRDWGDWGPRCGYTGEDGVELSCPGHLTTQLAQVGKKIG